MRYFSVAEDTRLLLILVIIISGAILVMGTLMVVLHCRRVREKHWRDKVTDNFTEQEVWPQSANNKVTLTQCWQKSKIKYLDELDKINVLFMWDSICINLGLWWLYKVGCVDFEIIPNSTSASAVGQLDFEMIGHQNSAEIYIALCLNFQKSNNFYSGNKIK